MTSEYLSSDFSYKKYSLEQLDNWVNDALNCEDLTPQDIYDTVIRCVDESVEYHKKYLTKSIELLSLLKGHRPSFEIDTSLDDIDASSGVSSATKKDWVDFWEETYRPEQYTEEEMNAMCDAAADKEKCREYNMREAEYYDKRAKLDASYDEMVAKGYTMTADGFWIKETEKGVATVSTKPDPYAKLIKEAGGYEWTPGMKSAGYNV
jgi:hypothetical protein